MSGIPYILCNVVVHPFLLEILESHFFFISLLIDAHVLYIFGQFNLTNRLYITCLMTRYSGLNLYCLYDEDVKRILLMQINDPRKAQLQADILDRVGEV